MVDLKKIQTFEQLVPKNPAKPQGPAGLGSGPSFEDTLQDVGGLQSPLAGVGAQALGKAAEGLKFSNHAVERMRTRGISYTPQDLGKIQDAISKAAAKGSKDSLILMDNSALIVSVKNKTVVTVMDKNALKENVFTNIDSTIVL